MMARRLTLVVAMLAIAGCSRDSRPEPPAVDQAQYQKDHDAWRAEERETVPVALPIVGIWPAQEGETPFGSDPALPIVLPAKQFSPSAGVIRRAGDDVRIVPEPAGGPAARFDAFDEARSVRVPDVRGGEMEFMATGQLVFRIGGQEMKLTAFGEPGSDDLLVLFKDPTNQSTTYRGYRFLPPPENKLPVSIEAGLKRLPAVEGY